MSVRGVFAVDRGIWEHPVFAREPFSEREAFIWLVGEAAFRSRRVRLASGAIVELARGQLAHSLRFMASKWRWSEARVRRYFVRLKNDAMIDAVSDAGQTVVTICNYDRYQRVSLPRDAASDAPSDAGATQERRKEEDIKNNKEEKPPSAGSPRDQSSEGKRSRSLDPRAYTPAFEAFWAGYPKTKTSNPKAVAFDVFVKLSTADQEAATASLPAFEKSVGNQFTGYQPPGAAVYLRQRRFDDFTVVANGAHADPEKIRAGHRTQARLFFSGDWHPNWGASPAEPGCTIPADVIAEAAQALGKPWPLMNAVATLGKSETVSHLGGAE